MVSSSRVAEIAQLFRRRFPPRTTVDVLPSSNNHVARAAAMAGMSVAFRGAASWPFPEFTRRLSSGRGPIAQLAGWEEVARHDAVRDHLADGIRAAPGGAAITEVALIATLTRQRADADIVARAPKWPEAAQQAFFEIKTGTFSEIRPNQQYVYALALIGEHVTSNHPQLATVGLQPGSPLPAMDFVFIDVPPDGVFQPALVLASEVNRAASIAQVMAYVAGVEKPQ